MVVPRERMLLVVRAGPQAHDDPDWRSREVAAMDVPLLMVAVYGMGILSIVVLTAVGLGIALKEGGWVTTGYLTALGAVLVEMARIGLRV